MNQTTKVSSISETARLEVTPSKSWSDDPWQENQSDTQLISNEGFLVINEGVASEMALGGNLCTLSLIQGTEYFPKLKDCILFIEDNNEVCLAALDRDLQ